MRELSRRLRFRRDHRWATGHLSDYLDGELASSSRRRWERHAMECPECRRHLALLCRMLGALRRLPPPARGADALQTAAAVRLRLGDAAPE
jgi:anti-sigma factor RsiW